MKHYLDRLEVLSKKLFNDGAIVPSFFSLYKKFTILYFYDIVFYVK